MASNDALVPPLHPLAVPISVVHRGNGAHPEQQPEDARAMPTHHSMRWRRRCLRWLLHHHSRQRCAEAALCVHSGIQRTQRRCQRIIGCAGAVIASAICSTVVPVGIVHRGGGVRPQRHPEDARAMPTHHWMRWRHHCLCWPLHHRSCRRCAERWRCASTAATRGCKGDANASFNALTPSLPPLAAPLSELFLSALCRGRQSTSLYTSFSRHPSRIVAGVMRGRSALDAGRLGLQAAALSTKASRGRRGRWGTVDGGEPTGREWRPLWCIRSDKRCVIRICAPRHTNLCVHFAGEVGSGWHWALVWCCVVRAALCGVMVRREGWRWEKGTVGMSVKWEMGRHARHSSRARFCTSSSACILCRCCVKAVVDPVLCNACRPGRRSEFPTKAGFREDKKVEKRRSVGGRGGLDGGNSSGGSSVALLRSAQHERFIDSERESQYGSFNGRGYTYIPRSSKETLLAFWLEVGSVSRRCVERRAECSAEHRAECSAERHESQKD